MLSLIGLFLVSLIVGVFTCTRVYLLVFRRRLKVKGTVYSLSSTPFLYWFVLFSATAGTIMTLGVAAVVAVLLIDP